MARRWTAVLIFAGLATAQAAGLPPDPPINESPANQSVDVPGRPMLCVDVTDPEADPLDVTFRGRRLTAEDFTIVGLPDTQFYSRDFPAVFDAQTQWIVNEKDARNILFVTHFGDIVQSGSNSNTVEWNRADASMSLLEDSFTTSLLDGIAYGLAPGNHDQSPLGSPRSGTDEGATTFLYTQHFGLHRFDGRAYYGGRYDFGDPASYPDNNDNNFQLFTAGGMDFIAFHLEFDNTDNAQRDAVLTWLDNILMIHADRRALITTHFMVTWFGAFSNQGLAIYEKVKDNPNVFLMMGGHQNGAARRTDTFQGNAIHSYLADYQNQAFGGNGWLRVMTFSPENDAILVETYSPWLDQFDTSPQNRFTLDYDMDEGLRFLKIGATVGGVPSGSTACIPWPGRRGGERYEWYVEISDRESTTTGPVWNFASSGDCIFDSDCLDSDPCTNDVCQAGVCQAPPAFDGDRDGVCGDVDNCTRKFNPAQVDLDADGRGDLCDVCPDVFDPSQADGDDDGAGDACDCQPVDPGDRQPPVIDRLLVNRIGSATAGLTWTTALGADAYSVTRGDLSLLGAGFYGSCLAEGLLETSHDDPALPVPGDGFFYLVQGQNFDCDLGPLGYTSEEVLRENLDPLACIGQAHMDDSATQESTIFGTVLGNFADTSASDDVWESITEELSHGNPSLRHSRLEHHWTVDVTGGSLVEFHVEGFRSSSIDGDNFVFEYSTDGGVIWNPIGLAGIPTSDNDIDLTATLPSLLSGPVLIRVVDTDRTAGNQSLDMVNIDELFVRSVP